MLKATVTILTIILLLFCREAVAAKQNKAKQEKINVIFELPKSPDSKDKKLNKVLEAINKSLKEKLNLKIKSSRRAYLESEGKTYLITSLKSIGYYKATVKVKDSMSAEFLESSATSNDITFQISLGPKFLISNITTDVTDSSFTPKSALNLPPSNWYLVLPGNPAIAKNIVQEEDRIQKYIENNNFLLHLEVKHVAIVNLEKNTVEISYNITTGVIAHVKEITFSGLKTIDKKYARKLVPIKDKEGFRMSKVDEAKISLQRSGLFNLVEPLIPESSEKNKEVELKFRVKERKHRTVKTGLNYSSDSGPGIILGWEHRNLYSQGEKINLSLVKSKKDTALGALFEKPFFLNDKQTLKVASVIAKKDTTAYFDNEASLSATIERILSKHWTGGVTTKYSINKIEDLDDIKSKFSLLSLPLYGIFDSRNDILNPSKGLLVNAEIIPFINTKDKSKFFKYILSGSGYIKINSKFEPVIAMRVATGKIAGAEAKNIAANERFYIGGGGSVRGYSYQLVGPIDKNNKPTGGDSFLESSLELRTKFTNNLGLAVFIDGGNVFSSNIKFTNKLLWSTGIGVRYYTNFGPIRADIAFPTKRRKNTLNLGKRIDKAFQVYFSIGQAF
ncbi:MAG: autotransporter assembly complex protein TamA [Janthinobacterium lividum]